MALRVRDELFDSDTRIVLNLGRVRHTYEQRVVAANKGGAGVAPTDFLRSAVCSTERWKGRMLTEWLLRVLRRSFLRHQPVPYTDLKGVWKGVSRTRLNELCEARDMAEKGREGILHAPRVS